MLHLPQYLVYLGQSLRTAMLLLMCRHLASDVSDPRQEAVDSGVHAVTLTTRLTAGPADDPFQIPPAVTTW